MASRDILLGCHGLCLVALIVLATVLPPSYATLRPGNPWGWRCVNRTCVKELNDATRSLPDLNTCKLTCAPESVLWPRPTGLLRLANETVSFFIGAVKLDKVIAPSPDIESLIRKAFLRFNNSLAQLSSKADGSLLPEGIFKNEVAQHRLLVEVVVVTEGKKTSLTGENSESYILSITTQKETHTTIARLIATEFFGARHALETLSQLVVSDEETGVLKVVRGAAVTDSPAFQYRGLMLDTARNYLSEAALRRTLDAMAATKLNTLHWHLTDSHSFPLALHSLPNMAYYGAYSPAHVYTPHTIATLQEYARVRGVRLVPELDAPAHVGSGWQWGQQEGLGSLVVCLNQEPWYEFCDEPPCGQLNPSVNSTYTLLGRLYSELLQLFPSRQYFHYGASQINLNCWNQTEEVMQYLNITGRGREADDLYDLWGEFQKRARELVTSADPHVTKGIVRSSGLTQNGRRQRYLGPDYYVIQVTSNVTQESQALMEEGYQVILSDREDWDLTCGLEHTLGHDPLTSCDTYNGWQKVYGSVIHVGGGPGEVLGGEAIVWGHQVDDANIDGKIWPRAAALGERLWTNPSTSWRDAEARFIHHRQRLVQRGIHPERVQPEWCRQNDGHCYLPPSQ